MNKYLLFDWGDTIMVDFKDQKGKMFLWDKIQPVKNAKTILAKLSKNFNCYLATNACDSTKSDIIKALKRVELDTFFTDIFCYKEIGAKKPSIQYYNYICNKLSTNLENLIMIGDDLENDIINVKKLGINTIWYNPKEIKNNYNGKIIKDLLELENVLNTFAK